MLGICLLPVRSSAKFALENHIAVVCKYCFVPGENECLYNPCRNGRCTDELNRYTCQCFDGYAGIDCERSKLRFSRNIKQGLTYSFSKIIPGCLPEILYL